MIVHILPVTFIPWIVHQNENFNSQDSGVFRLCWSSNISQRHVEDSLRRESRSQSDCLLRVEGIVYFTPLGLMIIVRGVYTLDPSADRIIQITDFFLWLVENVKFCIDEKVQMASI